MKMLNRRYAFLGIAILIWVAAFFVVGRLKSLTCSDEPMIGCPYSIAMWVIALVLMVGLVLSLELVPKERKKGVSIALLDPVTGLNNRRAFSSQAVPLMETAEKLSEKALVIVISVNDFDQVTVAGKDMANRAAILVADALRDSLRGSDLISRYNDDEFVCFLPKASSLFIQVITDRIHENVAAQNRQYSGAQELEVSVGAAELDPVAPLALERLVKAAYDDLFENLKARDSE
jgi:diguanylate cyclase (GGDEF)-like protein